MNARSTPTAVAEDAALLEEILEIAAARSADLTPAVYARFFASHREAADLFTVLNPTMPPLGCGQMLFEIISLLQDCASRKPHVYSYMRQIATYHAAFKVIDPALYEGFLAALADETSSLLGDDWTAPRAAAWARQSRALLQSLPVP